MEGLPGSPPAHSQPPQAARSLSAPPCAGTHYPHYGCRLTPSRSFPGCLRAPHGKIIPAGDKSRGPLSVTAGIPGRGRAVPFLPGRKHHSRAPGAGISRLARTETRKRALLIHPALIWVPGLCPLISRQISLMALPDLPGSLPALPAPLFPAKQHSRVVPALREALRVTPCPSTLGSSPWVTPERGQAVPAPHLDVPVGVQQDVLQLQVPVHDPVLRGGRESRG